MLQNGKGRKEFGQKIGSKDDKWNFQNDIKQAFAMAIPTDAMRERRMKEGRGFGDLDGGGGVYKGRKKGQKKMRK